MMLEEATLVRLMDIANAGCHNGMVLEARSIYNCVLLLKPGHIPARIGLALSHMVVGELPKAEAMLRDVVAEHASDADALSMLGFCLFLMKRNEEAAALLEPLKDAPDSAGSLARSLLQTMS